MRVFKGLSKIRGGKAGTVCTLGVFDGVHRGHARILNEVVRTAQKENVPSVVITFTGHPETVLGRRKVQMLTTVKKKLELMEALRIDIVVLIEFTPGFSRKDAASFVKDVLVERLHVRRVVVGTDYYFGRNRRGNPQFLKRQGKIFGFSVKGVKPLTVGGAVASSTAIRAAVARGDLDVARRMLGRRYSLSGTVVKGSGRGTKMGYPTANIAASDQVFPRKGAYAVMVTRRDRRYPGMCNIGYRPTVEAVKDRVVEVHLFGMNGDLYGRKLEMEFSERIRDERKFVSMGELASQLKLDSIQARKMLRDVIE